MQLYNSLQAVSILLIIIYLFRIVLISTTPQMCNFGTQAFS